jgi:hypothetical protein
VEGGERGGAGAVFVPFSRPQPSGDAKLYYIQFQVGQLKKRPYNDRARHANIKASLETE